MSRSNFAQTFMSRKRRQLHSTPKQLQCAKKHRHPRNHPQQQCCCKHHQHPSTGEFCTHILFQKCTFSLQDDLSDSAETLNFQINYCSQDLLKSVNQYYASQTAEVNCVIVGKLCMLCRKEKEMVSSSLSCMCMGSIFDVFLSGGRTNIPSVSHLLYHPEGLQLQL